MTQAMDDLGPRDMSIEDLVKKSVFSRCLRLLSSPDTISKRPLWFHMIQEIRSGTNLRHAKRPREDSSRSEEPSGDSTVAPEEPQSLVPEAEMTDKIAGFLREQIDAASGLPIIILSVSALMLFCTMLDAVPSRTKSKEALNNALMNFHFTKSDPIGKRIRTSHHIEQQNAQVAAMLSSAKSKTLSVTAPKVKKVLPTALAVATEESPETLHVQDAPTVFRKQQGQAHGLPKADAAEVSTSAVSMKALEKDVIIIVRCFDPITVDSLVKKVEAHGNYPSVTRSEILDIVSALHSRHVVYVERDVVFFEGS